MYYSYIQISEPEFTIFAERTDAEIFRWCAINNAGEIFATDLNNETLREEGNEIVAEIVAEILSGGRGEGKEILDWNEFNQEAKNYLVV
jgi:hypothetical protein